MEVPAGSSAQCTALTAPLAVSAVIIHNHPVSLLLCGDEVLLHLGELLGVDQTVGQPRVHEAGVDVVDHDVLLQGELVLLEPGEGAPQHLGHEVGGAGPAGRRHLPRPALRGLLIAPRHGVQLRHGEAGGGDGRQQLGGLDTIKLL